MPFTVTQLATTLQTLFTDQVQAAAQASGLIQRQGKLTAPAFVQGLVFGWLANPQATLEELAQAVTLAGSSLTPQALDQRFTAAAADCLRRVLLQAVAHVLQAAPAALPLLQRFPGVYLLDSSILPLPDALAEQYPGCGGRAGKGRRAALKIQVRFDQLRGGLELELQAGRDSDQKATLHTATLPAGSLRLADLGYFSLDVLRHYADQGVCWLSRVQPGTVVWDAQGHKRSLLEVLQKQKGQRVDLAVRLGNKHRLSCRLLAIRVPARVARVRRQRVLANAQKWGHKVKAERLALCAWNVYVTNAPVEKLSVQEAWVLARARWQIELLFKLWKSYGGVDESRSGKPYRVLCEVYAKLLAMVVQHWSLLLGCWQQVDKSLVKAARTVRNQGLRLLGALGGVRRLTRALAQVRDCLGQGCRMNKRRGRPHTYQTLLDPEKDGYGGRGQGESGSATRPPAEEATAVQPAGEAA